MIKLTQIFGWDNEPVAERPSQFMPSRLLGDSSFAALSAWAQQRPAAARKSPLLSPEAQRAPPAPGDASLSRLVPGWLQSLPVAARPDRLCMQFPRIANRLALCWSDPALAVRLLDAFFHDKRSGRKGFPPKVLQELKALRQLAAQRMRAPVR